MSIESEMDEATERAKKMAATRLADDLDRLCCAETEAEFFKYVTDRISSITALLRVYAKSDLRAVVTEFANASQSEATSRLRQMAKAALVVTSGGRND